MDYIRGLISRLKDWRIFKVFIAQFTYCHSTVLLCLVPCIILIFKFISQFLKFKLNIRMYEVEKLRVAAIQVRV